MEDKKVKEAVRKSYGEIAGRRSSCCPVTSAIASLLKPIRRLFGLKDASTSSCCLGNNWSKAVGPKIGYTEEELRDVPEGACLVLGCGNPVALASLREGEVVVDLGSGAGLDCFLAAKKVGKAGKVVGIDMTPEMVERARESAKEGGYQNVEFRLSEIENIPCADSSADVVISNCVINLSPDKPKVFREAFRVLKPGGRMMVSDMVLLKELPEFLRNSTDAYAGCIAGAMMKDDYIHAIEGAGFQDVKIVGESSFSTECILTDPIAKSVLSKMNISAEDLDNLLRSAVSMKVEAKKAGQM